MQPEVNHTSTLGGNYRIWLAVTDSLGENAQAELNLTVIGPLAVRATVSGPYGTSCGPGHWSYLLSSSASGGVPPYATAWTSPGFSGPLAGSWVNVSVVVPGSYAAIATVTDSRGTQAAQVVQIQGYPATCVAAVRNHPANSTPDYGTLVLLGAAGVVLAGAVVIAVERWRVRRRPPP